MVICWRKAALNLIFSSIVHPGSLRTFVAVFEVMLRYGSKYVIQIIVVKLGRLELEAEGVYVYIQIYHS